MDIRSFVLLMVLFLAPLHTGAQDHSIPADSARQSGKSIYKAVGYTSAYYAGSMYLLSKAWYKDRNVVPFHFYNDTGAYLQVDKFGHTFGAYVYSYAGYHFLRNAGLSEKEALWYGGTLGLVLQTPIEIMDGIYEGCWATAPTACTASLKTFPLLMECLSRKQPAIASFSCRWTWTGQK